MAVGYANETTLDYLVWTGLATPAASAGLIQSISSPGWTRAVADITAIDAANALLRKKIASQRLEQNGITVPFFYDPEATGIGSPPLTANALTVTYATGMVPASVFTQSCWVTAFSIGNAIDDEISVGECEFMPAGAEAFDDPTV